VRGFADQSLRLPDKPQDPSNRRVTLIVQYLVKDGSEVAPTIDLTHLADKSPNEAPEKPGGPGELTAQGPPNPPGEPVPPQAKTK
jgi:chemotaxis protein MotB